MSNTNRTVQVTFKASDLEVMSIICEKKNLTLPALVKKVMEDWLQHYEDSLLAKRAEEIEKKWEENGQQTITHEEIWKSRPIKYT